MIALLVLLFFVYNYILLDYAANIYEFRGNKLKIYSLVAIIGATLITLYIYKVDSLKYEYLLMIGYVLIYSITFRFLSNHRWLFVFFGLFAFTINFISRRILALSVIALFYKTSMSEVYESINVRILLFAIPFAISSPYITATRKFLHKKYMDVILMNRDNIKFSVSIMGYSCLFLFIALALFNFEDVQSGYVSVYVITGCITSVSYHIAIGLGYVFAKMQINIDKLKELQQVIEDEEENIVKLENESLYDHFTGVMTRDGAYNQIEKNLKNKEEFYVVFIDMDGLKIVNDMYGHGEGDFYIKNVSDRIKDSFKGDIISRFGGDEFLVVGKMIDQYAPLKKSVMCYENVLDIQKHFKTNYSTSISYGISRVSTFNNLSIDEIIKEADEKMYEFKKSRNKQRSVKAVK